MVTISGAVVERLEPLVPWCFPSAVVAIEVLVVQLVEEISDFNTSFFSNF